MVQGYEDYIPGPDGLNRVYCTSDPTRFQSARKMLAVEKFLLAMGEIGDLNRKELAKVQARVGKWVEDGKHGMRQSDRLAHKLFKMAAENGHKHSARDLANEYRGNLETHKAFRYYRIAAKAGCAEAQYKVGKYLWLGRGVKQDRNDGLEWLRRSADRGNPSAAKMYENVRPWSLCDYAKSAYRAVIG